MTVAFFHEPETFPSLEFFYGLLNSDIWVCLDHLRFHTRCAQNQCRIRSPTGIQVLRIAVKHPCNKPIYMMMINNYAPWKRYFLKSIENSYEGTEYYNLYIDGLHNLIEGPTVLLENLNIQAIRWIASLLDKSLQIICTNTIYEKYPKSKIIKHLCEKLHATQFTDKYEPEYYPQISEPFEENLSTLDPLFSVGAEDTRRMLMKIE